jgi:Sigma 54 modulation protein / S30EA ribosomal protein
MMVIDIQGIAGNRLLQAHVRRQMGAALTRLHVTPVSAQVLFLDENGPKGGIDIRCALTVCLPRHPSVRVEHMAQTSRRAFDEAFTVLERQLGRDIERAPEPTPTEEVLCRQAPPLGGRREAQEAHGPDHLS